MSTDFPWGKVTAICEKAGDIAALLYVTRLLEMK